MTYTKLPCHETPSGRFECVLSEREVTGVTVTAGASAAVGTRCLHHSRADARAPGPARDCCPPCGGLGRQGLGEGQAGVFSVVEEPTLQQGGVFLPFSFSSQPSLVSEWDWGLCHSPPETCVSLCCLELFVHSPLFPSHL